jgi:hypothetical protein
MEKDRSFKTLRLIAEGLTRLKLPDLTPVDREGVMTLEVIGWGTRLYCFSWLRHMCMVSNGMMTLADAGNIPSARILGRTAYELGAHAYYVKKHLRQFTEAGELTAAWEFLTPIAVGSRYISEQNPKDSDAFISPPHIKKAINCFKEVLPPYAKENYSYLSEFCHPNMLALRQYYDWTGPGSVKFVDRDPTEGVFGPPVAAIIQGLLAADDLLEFADGKTVSQSLHQFLEAMAQQIK